MRRMICIYLMLFVSVYTYSARIHGRVIDKQDKQPLAGVSIQILHSKYAASTDYNGNYAFKKLPAGVYKIEFSATGYIKKVADVILSKDQLLQLEVLMEAMVGNLPEVSVLGYSQNETEKAIRLQQRNANQLVNILSADRIEKSSDVTIADVMQRMSGLSVVKDNNGQATKTIIRGMESKYNYTLVNGVKISSPDDHSRYIPLNIFPADMVQRLEVYKTMTPDMEADAIGGAVNMVIRDAPDQEVFSIKESTGYNQFFFDQSFTSFNNKGVNKQSPYEHYGAGYYATANDFTKDNLSFINAKPLPDLLSNVIWGKRFLKKKLGVLIAADYQNIKSGSHSFFIPQNNEPQLNNRPGLTDFYVRDYSDKTIRKELYNKLDYVFNERNKISLYQFYINQNDIETRNTTDTSLVQGRTKPGTGRITISQRSRLHTQDIYSATLHGEHTVNTAFKINWSTVYSVAKGLYPDWAELTATTGRIETADGNVQQTPLLLAPLHRTWLGNKERDISIYLNSNYSLPFLKRSLTVNTGGLYRTKQRENFYNNYTFNPAITGNMGQPFIDIYHAQWLDNNGPQNPLGATRNANTYTGNEDVAAYYLSASLKLKKSQLLAGLRYEHTAQKFESTVDPTISYGKNVSIHYHDFLPGIHWKYAITNKQNLHASYYRSLSRPALYDVTFFSIHYEDYVEAGNPFLKRAHANNFDVRYDWYGKGLDMFEAGLFYKRIADPYEKALLNANDVLFPIADQGLNYTPAGQLTQQMKNFGTASNFGVEVALQKYFGKLGIQANYTYTYSNINQVKKFKTRADPNNAASDIITISKNESRPLEGQSNNLANLCLIFNNPQIGFNAQVSAVFTGKRIYAVSGWYGLDYWQRALTVIDISTDKKIGKHLQVFIKINNLLNAATVVDLLQPNPGYKNNLLPAQETGNKITVMKQYNKAVYYIGVKYKLR